MKLTDFAALTFDCYGTLIDWESGMLAALRPSFARRRPDLADEALLETHGRIEAELEAAHPKMLYSEILRRTYLDLAKESGIAPDEAAAARYAASLRDWPAFPDTAAALQYLKRHYRLVILSNVDRASFRFSLPKLGVEFDAVLTAEEIGSYKPDRRNFHYMVDKLAEMGVPKERILHTAQSLFHDHVPAKELGLATAWINRRHDKTGPGATRPTAPVKPDFVANSMAELVAQHQASKRA
jgi:2-haloacid dehalogenase